MYLDVDTIFTVHSLEKTTVQQFRLHCNDPISELQNMYSYSAETI
jgi:hypothetical protein